MQAVAKKKKLPRLAIIVDEYLAVIENAVNIPPDERMRMKGVYVKRLRREVDAMKASRAGFTLVEMLISVALVVLMMTLFATIFQIATSAMSTQKGLAENDQRVRLVMNRLRNDLNGIKNDGNDSGRPYRTFRNLVPYAPDESGLPNFSPTDRNGYFYISENNPDDDTDDVLALTVQYPATASDQYFGQASVLFPQKVTGDYGLPSTASGTSPGPPKPSLSTYPPSGIATVPVASAPGSGQVYFPNQPDFDDILGVPNKVGNSPFAEVCYFLRKGTLYRRVLLIRSPNVANQADGNPKDGAGVNLNMGTYTNSPPARSFLNDFDYASYFDSLGGTGFSFHGTGTTVDSMAFTNPFGLGNPACRFGFDISTTTNSSGATIPSATYGLPREYVQASSGGTATFIGRFTHAETSDTAFGYPTVNTATNPMSGGTYFNVDPLTGRVGNFSGPRAGEDILMTNVLKFDIKVFDPAASLGGDGLPGIGGVDDDGDGNRDFLPSVALDMKELGWPGSDDGDFVDIGNIGVNGFYNSNPRNVPAILKRKFVGSPYTTANSTTRVYPNTRYSNAATGANRYDTWGPSIDHDNDLINDSTPFKPYGFGADNVPGSLGVDLDGDGVKNNIAELGWPGSDDQPIPLSAIQIKITFYDITSNQVREITLVQSLLYVP